MENKRKKTVKLKKTSPVIKTLLSTVTRNLQKKENIYIYIIYIYEKIFGFKKVKFSGWGCLVCNFETLAKIVQYFTAFPFHV